MPGLIRWNRHSNSSGYIVSSVMRSRNYTAVQFDKSFGKHSELERYISKTNGEIKKKREEGVKR